METKLRAVVLTTAAFRRQVGHDPGHGLGKATPFDLRNAAERVLLVLSADPHRDGAHSSVALR